MGISTEKLVPHELSNLVPKGIRDFGGKVGDLAENLTGNALGIPGLDRNMIESPTDIGHMSPVTRAALLAGGGELAGSALGGAGASAAGTGGGAAEQLGIETLPVQDIAVDPSLSAPFGNAAAGTGIWAGNTFANGSVVPFGAPGDVSATTGASAGGGGAAAPGAAKPVSPTAPGAAPSPAGGATAPAGAAGGAQGAQTQSAVGNILKSMRENAGLIQLGLTGAAALSLGQKKIPNEQQLNDLAATGSQVAKDLISQYRSGQLSAAQQAQLDQVSQQTKNQINQYFASIGQSDSTAHQQALAQVDQQALGMKQNMLQNALTQGLNAIGVASGPLRDVANFQIGQDKALTDAFGNFANAIGQVYGRSSGTTQAPTVTGQTPSSGMAVRSGSGQVTSTAQQ